VAVANLIEFYLSSSDPIVSVAMMYLCDRWTCTDDMEEKDRRICRSKLRNEVWQLQDSVQYLTHHQVGPGM
jgi:hypothetical protein